jgi:predicted aminopeptidase
MIHVRQAVKPLSLTFTLILILLLISGPTACSGPGYYLQAISGQWKLMHARQDIQSLLNDPATSPELSKQLQLANRIKTFSQDSLDLPSDGSYTSYVAVNGDAIVWNVVATDEFSLEAKRWCFPVAGCVPYRGFFKQQKARDSAARLLKKGKDVHVSPVAAYSSLGWFNDPLLSTMLFGSESRLAAFLFHELAHQRLYVKDDGEFNEGYASFVEETGLKAWLEAGHRETGLQQWRQGQLAAKDFRNLVDHVREQLNDLYRSDQPELVKRELKAGIFGSFSDSLETLRVNKWQGKRYFASWSENPLNNARFALYNTYEGSHCAFRKLWLEAGRDAKMFHRLAEQKSRLQRDERTEWLKQSCTSRQSVTT